jgi:hypothetical protein
MGDATFTTRDLGFAIRDHLENSAVAVFTIVGDEIHEGERTEIGFVDISDPDNPIVHFPNGQRFQLRIIAV